MSKAKVREAEEARKRRALLMTLAIALATLLIVLIIVYILFFNVPGGSPVWKLDSSDRLSFGARGPVEANVQPLAPDDASSSLEKVAYKSFGVDVFTLLRVPKNVSTPPVVIVLPGATINKEADAAMAKALCSWGYASLTLDERGNNGETSGPNPMDLQSGYQAFASGGDPVQYRQVYDVLLGYDYLRSRPDLDGDSVVVLGESMGGRFAIVAAALEPRLEAAIVISSGPYGMQGGNDPKAAQFIRSIEPASYLPALPPRKLALFHFSADPIVPASSGRSLYDAAGEPKSWHEYNGTVHGIYSDVYAADLQAELKGVFGR